jgi:uncharacterized protein (TIGR02246 family)
MKPVALICGAAALTLAMNACRQVPETPTNVAPDTHNSDIKSITEDEVQWNSDWAAKDGAKVLAHYADDAVLMTPGMEAVKGKDAIKGALDGMLADQALSLKFKANNVVVSTAGDLAYTQGDYTMTMTDPASHKVMNDHGSYVTTYRKQKDGSWKAVADIATSAVPPPAPKHKG